EYTSDEAHDYIAAQPQAAARRARVAPLLDPGGRLRQDIACEGRHEIERAWRSTAQAGRILVVVVFRDHAPEQKRVDHPAKEGAAAGEHVEQRAAGPVEVEAMGTEEAECRPQQPRHPRLAVRVAVQVREYVGGEIGVYVLSCADIDGQWLLHGGSMGMRRTLRKVGRHGRANKRHAG